MFAPQRLHRHESLQLHCPHPMRNRYL
jgi:hypothetical protein